MGPRLLLASVPQTWSRTLSGQGDESCAQAKDGRIVAIHSFRACPQSPVPLPGSTCCPQGTKPDQMSQVLTGRPGKPISPLCPGRPYGPCREKGWVEAPVWGPRLRGVTQGQAHPPTAASPNLPHRFKAIVEVNTGAREVTRCCQTMEPMCSCKGRGPTHRGSSETWLSLNRKRETRSGG